MFITGRQATFAFYVLAIFCMLHCVNYKGLIVQGVSATLLHNSAKEIIHKGIERSVHDT